LTIERRADLFLPALNLILIQAERKFMSARLADYLAVMSAAGYCRPTPTNQAD